MTAIYRSTSRGQQVVCGTPEEVHVGEVVVDIGGPHFPKLVTAQVVAVGQPFVEFGRTHVYGYLTAPAAPTSVPAPAARPAGTRRAPSRGRARAAAPYRGPVGNPSTPDCEDCLDVEDAGDARGCAAHRH